LPGIFVCLTFLADAVFAVGAAIGIALKLL